MSVLMEIIEIENLILKRLYEEAFKDYAEHKMFDLRAFASDQGIPPDLLEIAYEELNQKGFFDVAGSGMTVTPSIWALIYCEQEKLVDPGFVEKQDEIRKKILEACFDIDEEKPLETGASSKEICSRSGVSTLDFQNNIEMLVHRNLVEQAGPLDLWKILPRGKDFVNDLRKKIRRQGEFKNLSKSPDGTPQERGHKLEDILTEVIEDEGWEVKKRVRTETAEFDIVFNKAFDYFMVSCKWEKKAINASAVDVLAARAGEMGCTAGILVSMSGFTAGCLKAALAKRSSHQVVLFGYKDIADIFLSETRFTSLLDEKIRELKLRNRILVDGE